MTRGPGACPAEDGQPTPPLPQGVHSDGADGHVRLPHRRSSCAVLLSDREKAPWGPSSA